MRPIARDEIVLDCDDRDNGDLGIRQLCIGFSLAGYCIEIYRAEGQKSYHAHIKGIPHIADLPKEQNRLYKELLIKKYIQMAREYHPCPALDKLDFSPCIPDHLIAQESKAHFKYGSVKKLIAVVNEGYQNFCDSEIYNLAMQTTTLKPLQPSNIEGSGVTAQIIRKIKIISIAQRFGISVNNNGMAECPFHPDTKPSLKFYSEQGRFYCFGCHLHGNIIFFYALCKKNLEKLEGT